MSRFPAGKSNSGEGGEDPVRWEHLGDIDDQGNSPTLPHLKGLQTGDTANSRIKQVCSAVWHPFSQSRFLLGACAGQDMQCAPSPFGVEQGQPVLVVSHCLQRTP